MRLFRRSPKAPVPRYCFAVVLAFSYDAFPISFQGLNDLYDFRLKHPDADLEPFIRKSSQFFQTYIERGLKNIELERQGKQTKHSHDATLNVTGEWV